jgi:aminopeptidase N
MYHSIAGTQMDVPQIVNSVVITDHIFQLHEYMRSSLGFWTLRDIMGEELYHKCIIEFIKRWEGKHPTPWDFFFTCNSVSGEDYSWFFEAWFHRYGYPDLSIPSAIYDNNNVEVTIENTGGMPFPCKLAINYDDKSSDVKILNGKQWKDSKLFTISIPAGSKPLKVYLDTSGYPDTDEANNEYIFEVK